MGDAILREAFSFFCSSDISQVEPINNFVHDECESACDEDFNMDFDFGQLTHCSLNSVASVKLLFSFARKTKDVTSEYYINVAQEYKYNKIQLQQFRVCRTDGSVHIFLPSHSKAIRQKVAKAILTNTLYINVHMSI